MASQYVHSTTYNSRFRQEDFPSFLPGIQAKKKKEEEGQETPILLLTDSFLSSLVFKIPSYNLEVDLQSI
jgi:hypothetical protein